MKSNLFHYLSDLVKVTFFVSLLIGCSTQESKPAITLYEIPYASGAFQISAVSDEIINVRYTDSLTYSNRNYAPILLNSIALNIQDNENQVTIKTSRAGVVITKEPFQILFVNSDGTIKTSTSIPFSRNTDTTVMAFNLSDKEAIYGTGSRALPMNRRGYKLEVFNKAHYSYQMGSELLNYCIPHITSSEDYMLLIDNPAQAWMDIGKSKENEFIYSSLGGNISYYFITGDSKKELITLYTELTGKQEIPPIWLFGNLQSRFGYRNQEQAVSLLNKTMDAGYPIDAMILDIYWFGPELQDGQMGKLTWDNEKWSEPVKMIEDFHSKGVKTISVSEPFFTIKSGRFEDLASKGLLGKDSTGAAMQIPYFYFGNTGLLDIFNPEAKQWVWDQYKRLGKDGIDGWWVDLGEPEVHPGDMIHINGPGRELHGAYGHEWAKMLYDNYAADFPNERLFHMGRAGFAGSQRYSLIPWSGDVSRTWSGLQAQIPIMLGIGMSGIGYMHSDAGGFAFVEKANPELYTRWLQFAVFTPVFRPHADEVVPPEPVTWSEEVQKNVKPVIELRYKMLPYNYTLAWKNMTTGLPLARPMFVEFENVSDTLITQYMWGSDLLVSPVLKKGQTSKLTYLPEGEWYDFNTQENIKGGKWVEKQLASDKIPVYVKGGSIIPLAKKMKNTDRYRSDTLDLYYYHVEGQYENVFYFDDGKTRKAFDKGKYQLVKAQTNSSKASTSIKLTMEGQGYEGAPTSRGLTFHLAGLTEIKSVEIDGKAIEFNNEDGEISFALEYTNSINITINH